MSRASTNRLTAKISEQAKEIERLHDSCAELRDVITDKCERIAELEAVVDAAELGLNSMAVPRDLIKAIAELKDTVEVETDE